MHAENCASNDAPHDDAFYSRISWEVIRFIEGATGRSCPEIPGSDKQLPYDEALDRTTKHRDSGHRATSPAATKSTCGRSPR